MPKDQISTEELLRCGISAFYDAASAFRLSAEALENFIDIAQCHFCEKYPDEKDRYQKCMHTHEANPETNKESISKRPFFESYQSQLLESAAEEQKERKLVSDTNIIKAIAEPSMFVDARTKSDLETVNASEKKKNSGAAAHLGTTRVVNVSLPRRSAEKRRASEMENQTTPFYNRASRRREV